LLADPLSRVKLGVRWPTQDGQGGGERDRHSSRPLAGQAGGQLSVDEADRLSADSVG
jgi:hypothetical protein